MDQTMIWIVIAAACLVTAFLRLSLFFFNADNHIPLQWRNFANLVSTAMIGGLLASELFPKSLSILPLNSKFIGHVAIMIATILLSRRFGENKGFALSSAVVIALCFLEVI